MYRTTPLSLIVYVSLFLFYKLKAFNWSATQAKSSIFFKWQWKHLFVFVQFFKIVVHGGTIRSIRGRSLNVYAHTFM